MLRPIRTAHRTLLLAGVGAALVPAQAFAAPKTAAGTPIANTATASYDTPNGGPRASVDSNTVTIRVDELVDLVVATSGPTPVPSANGATKQVLSFVVTNAGNGPESYRLTASGTLTGDDFDPADLAIYIDDGNGVYEEGVDLAYTAGANDPALTPDQSRTVFILATVPAGAANGQTGRVQLTATSTTGAGTGAPGAVVSGAGANGVDAVFGPNGGDDAAVNSYAVVAAQLALTKAQSVADPFGGTRAVPGSTITYTLTASVSGSGALSGLAITDTVPAGSTYVANSITLGGAARTDAADGDEGQFDAGSITVSLGTVPASETRVVTFQVKVD